MGIKPSGAALNGAQNNGPQRVLRFKEPINIPANTSTVLGTTSVSVLEFRGAFYKVKPVGYRPGLQMQTVQFELAGLVRALENLSELPSVMELDPVSAGEQAAATDELMEKLMEKMDEAAQLMKLNCKPLSLLQRLFLWPLPSHNPFSAASQAELGDLLSFFSACRTKSSVQRFGLTRLRRTG